MRKRTSAALALAVLLIPVLAAPAGATPVRVKDIVSLEGADPVEIYGYGLVIGLNGTGDGRTISYTRQSIRNLLERMGLTVDNDRIRAKNIASVMVAATITPWDRPGSLVDVSVSSIGDATSLAGGYLLLTELRGPDGLLYATSQGALSVGGFDVSTLSGARVRRNYVTSGRVPEGGRVVATPEFEMPADGRIHLHLDSPDFATAVRVGEALNRHWNLDNAASAVDAGRVALELSVLPEPNSLASTLAALEDVSVEPATVAKIVINERTGTLVAGRDVRVQPATVSHGNLHVRIETSPVISQPAPFSQTGQTVFTRAEDIGFDTGRGGVVALPSTTTADELATALNALGVEPRDLIAIFQALKEAGALPAKMEIL